MKSKIQNSKSKINFVIWILSFVIFLAGCGPEWKKKFVRKRAHKTAGPVFVYEQAEYQRAPSDELYKRHFIFWKAWQEELVNKLGENRSSDIRSFEEALKNLDEMRGSLKDEKAAEAEGYRKELEGFYTAYKTNDLGIVRSRQMRQDLDRLMLRIDKALRYNRVKDYIKDK